MLYSLNPYTDFHQIFKICLAQEDVELINFDPTARKGYQGVDFTQVVRMGRGVVGKSLSGLYLRNCKV